MLNLKLTLVQYDNYDVLPFKGAFSYFSFKDIRNKLRMNEKIK